MTGRVALVTGGGRGIGLATARRLAQDGFALALADIDAARAAASAVALTAEGITAAGFGCDVSDTASVAAMVAEVEARFGRIDVLVNSAGILPRVNGRNPTVEGMPVEIWLQTLAVNLTGTFLVCRAVVPVMKRSGWGRIVNISSRSGRMRTAGNAHYSASKSGLFGLSRVLAGEVGAYGITVNCIAPSRIDTELNRNLENIDALQAQNAAESPLGRLAEPEDVANTVAFLASDQASFLTGTIIDVTGGTYMP